MPKQIFYTYKDYEGFDGCDFTQFKKGKLYFDKGKIAHKLVICPFCGRVAREEKEGTFFNHKMSDKNQKRMCLPSWDIVDSCSFLTQDEYYQILNKVDIIRTANSYRCLSKVKWDEFSDLELWIAIACRYVTKEDVPRKIDYKAILKQEVAKKKAS